IQNSATLNPTDGVVDYQGPGSHDFGEKTANYSGNTVLNASDTDLSAFIGTGKITVSETAAVSSNDTGTGNFDKRIRSQANADVRIVYHYIPTSCLAPGDYIVKQPTEPPGFLDGEDTSDNITPLPNSVGTDQINVHLDAESNSVTNNFGEIVPSSLAGF